MSTENLLNPVGEDECSWELSSPQEVYEESFEEACEAADEEAEHSNQPQQDTEHVPTSIEALQLINKLWIFPIACTSNITSELKIMSLVIWKTLNNLFKTQA
ncbi:hypothetical protein CROQUDRAFT_88683 [Cronartium quercuum f. sp. fusiforme G11]|uniref:Uncharacterized protein n=1 Tax=Cronartium quercuum f. sp. fusiforme G11 TaxID=708437 RepID=A0A9P6NMH2_9BASI|nr:hypothetical protein CROQUDRAFT_88683 [Cronartium quercuum f. sp. fusiforme G11]